MTAGTGRPWPRMGTRPSSTVPSARCSRSLCSESPPGSPGPRTWRTRRVAVGEIHELALREAVRHLGGADSGKGPAAAARALILDLGHALARRPVLLARRQLLGRELRLDVLGAQLPLLLLGLGPERALDPLLVLGVRHERKHVVRREDGRAVVLLVQGRHDLLGVREPRELGLQHFLGVRALLLGRPKAIGRRGLARCALLSLVQLGRELDALLV